MSMQNPSTKRYIRIKRRNQTYCLLCDESDSIASVKEQLTCIIQQFETNKSSDDDTCNKLRLLHETSQAVLRDEETLQEAQVQDNQVLHLVYCINQDDDEYEPVEVVAAAVPGGVANSS